MTSGELAQRLSRIARAGQWTVGLALAVLAGFFVYYMWLQITDPFANTAILIEEFELPELAQAPALWQSWIAAILWILTDVIGMAIFLTALGLFGQFRRGAVFEFGTVRRLGRIGWLLVAIAPMSVFSSTVAVLVLTITNPAGERTLSITIDDGDIYAIVVGLIIVATSLAMSEALRLARENESFV